MKPTLTVSIGSTASFKTLVCPAGRLLVTLLIATALFEEKHPNNVIKAILITIVFINCLFFIFISYLYLRKILYFKRTSIFNYFASSLGSRVGDVERKIMLALIF